MGLKKPARVSAAHLLVFALVFGLLGIVLWQSMAAPNPNLQGDLNGDNVVDASDLSILLSDFNTTKSEADINGDGTVDVLDLSYILSNYGQSYSGGGMENLPACTMYISPGGGGNGTSSTSPTTLATARSSVNPGDVVCFMPGTYNLGTSPWYEMGSRSGTASAWITYRSYDPDNQALIEENFSSGGALFKITGGSGHGAYIEFADLTFDGQGHHNAYEAIIAGQGAHHIKMVGNTVRDMSDSGLAGSNADYLIAIGNMIYHNGPGLGNDEGGSGITWNWNGGPTGGGTYDSAPGFHSMILDNIITGSYDTVANQDGNGIILDLGGAMPPVLVANNVVYMNGGRGIEVNEITGPVYVINNTLYKNALDKASAYMEMPAFNADGGQTTWANNIVYAWTGRYSYYLSNTGASETYSKNVWYGGSGNYNVGSVTSGQIANFDPEFVSPPSVDPSNDGQYLTSPDPSALGSDFKLQSGSPAINGGIDPRSLAGLDSTMLSQITQYVMVDINGTARPQGGGFDMGAYEQ